MFAGILFSLGDIGQITCGFHKEEVKGIVSRTQLYSGAVNALQGVLQMNSNFSAPDDSAGPLPLCL